MNDISATLYILRLVQLILWVPLLALIGQGVLWAMIRVTGQPADRNFFYRILETISSPFTKLLRLLTPRVIADRHIPWALLGLLIVSQVWILFALINTCIGAGVPVAECRQIR